MRESILLIYDKLSQSNQEQINEFIKVVSKNNNLSGKWVLHGGRLIIKIEQKII